MSFEIGIRSGVTPRSGRVISVAARAAAISLFVCSQGAFASLILTSPTPFTGTGLGTVPTILTIQDSPSEIGCVGFTGTGSTYNASGVCTGSNADVKTGASQTELQPLSAAAGGAITSAANFAFIFNVDQPKAGPITLTGAEVAFYTSTGTFLYESNGLSCAGLASSPTCTFPTTFSGIGKSGFEFQLDAAQQAAATAAGAFASSSNLVGLSASANLSDGGPETFYLLNANGGGGGGGGGKVPEPSSIFLSAIGLAFLGFSTVGRRYWLAK